MTTFELLTLSLGLVSIGGLSLQVHYAAKALREDHLRRKRQATLDYLITDLRQHWREVLRDVEARFGTGEFTEATLAELRTDQPMNSTVVRVLGSLEHMALGVNMDVYDFEVINRASGAFLNRLFLRFHAYIASAQRNQPTAYIEFTRLVEAIRNARGLGPLPAVVPLPKATTPLPSSSASGLPSSAREA